jgi:hypothetical protein
VVRALRRPAERSSLRLSQWGQAAGRLPMPPIKEAGSVVHTAWTDPAGIAPGPLGSGSVAPCCAEPTEANPLE